MTIVPPAYIGPILARMENLFSDPIPPGGAITDIKVSILAQAFFQEGAQADLLPKHILKKEISDEFSFTLPFNRVAYLEELSRILQTFVEGILQAPRTSFVAGIVDMSLVMKIPAGQNTTTVRTVECKQLMLAQSRHLVAGGGDPVP